MRHVALLRGINLGGRNRLAMADLSEMFADAGCADVVTYVQSGNVVFDASAAIVKGLPERIAAAIDRRFGFGAPVIMRTASEIVAVAGRNPFLERGADVATLHVAFLDRVPERKNAAALDPDRSPGDGFALRGRDLYLCLPNGVARTRLTSDYLDRTLGTTATVRNWNTVRKLLELVAPVRG